MLIYVFKEIPQCITQEIMRQFWETSLFRFPSLKRTKSGRLEGKDELLEEDNMIDSTSDWWKPKKIRIRRLWEATELRKQAKL